MQGTPLPSTRCLVHISTSCRPLHTLSNHPAGPIPPSALSLSHKLTPTDHHLQTIILAPTIGKRLLQLSIPSVLPDQEHNLTTSPPAFTKLLSYTQSQVSPPLPAATYLRPCNSSSTKTSLLGLSRPTLKIHSSLPNHLRSIDYNGIHCE